MKKYISIFALGIMLSFMLNPKTVMSSDYETILAESGMSASNLNYDPQNNPDRLDNGSPHYTCNSSGMRTINAEIKTNIFQYSTVPPAFFSNFWEVDSQKNYPPQNIITYSKKVSAQGEITNFHVHFHYQSLNNSSNGGFLLDNLP